jgi:two-component system chemotaxis response regulator CheY
MRRIVAAALKRIGVTDVVEAANGAEGLEKCDGGVDLIITDWNMPIMGGLDFVRALRSKTESAKTPVLMVTTRGSQEDILKAAEAGVNGYILKPFTPNLLEEKINQITAVA